MKHIFTFIAAGFICSLSYGQTEQKIHKNDGSILQLPLSGIDSINFSVSPPASLHIHQTGNVTESILLNDIDSVTYAGTDWGQPMLIPLAGQVSDEDGQPVPGAVIRVGSLTVTSDTNGVFYLSTAPVLERLGYVTVSKTGFFPGSRTFLPTEGTNRVEIRLLRKNTAGTFQAASGGTVQAEGVSITFTGGGFTKNGTTFNGQVHVTLNYINPESDHFDSEMPGNLLGFINGNSRYLISYGMFAAELADNAGNKVELAPGATAQVRFPLSSTLQADAPAEIDLWYFDEETSLWQHEGIATRQGNEYAAAVSHFSFWNCDIPFPYIEWNGTVTDGEGNAVSGAKVTLTRNSLTRASASDFTSSSGHFGGYVPSGEVLNLKVSLSCDTIGMYEEVYRGEVGPFSQKTTLSPVHIETHFTMISGTIKGCQNSAAKNGYIVSMRNVYFADTSGDFSFFSCANGNLTLQAFTSQPWGAGTSKSINSTGSSQDVGDMMVCGNAGGTVSDIDGNLYPTVIIGTQEWMQENLKTTKFSDGSLIPNVTDSITWSQVSTPAWCNYFNNAANDVKYGKLYNWYTAADPRNVCPAGWHVPTDVEWTTLTDFLGGSSVAGGKMKTTTGWSDYQGLNGNGTNESGFSALPGGIRYPGVAYFSTIDKSGNYWSSSIENPYTAWFRHLDNRNQDALRTYNNRRTGVSVRCLRD